MAACRDEWVTNPALGLAEHFARQGQLDPAAGLSLLHQAFFLGDARCAFFGEESVASVARLLGLPFLQSETDRLLARLRAVRTRLLRRAREAGAQGLFDAGDYAQRAADFAEALEDLAADLAEAGRVDAVVACYNRGSARYLREQDWEVEGLLCAAEKEGPAEWAECARALGVVADAPIALDSRCEQLAGLEPGLEPGLSTVEAAELVVLLLVRGFVARKECPMPSAMGVWSGHWSERLHGLSLTTEGSFADVMRGVLMRLMKLDKPFFPLLQSCILFCQQVPSLQRAMPVVDALLPFMQEMLYELMARNTDDSEPAPNDYEEDSDCPCLLQQCA